MEPEPLGQFYARKVGETQRELQRLERERRRLVGVTDHAYIDLELAQAGDETAELARRGADVEVAASEHRDELLRLTIEILKLHDRLLYYRQLEALHADGTVSGPN
jgi:cytosine/adenosine deaminase-related metal-dependent hydrolase